MNKIEFFIYNIVRKNPAIKQTVRNIYQRLFDLLPKKKEFFQNIYQFKEGYFYGFHDINPFSFDETKLLSNQNIFDLRMPKPSEGLNVGYFDIVDGKLGDFHQFGTSYAWNFHKGCRLQWLNQNEIIYNTAIQNKLVSKIYNISSKEERIIPYPIDSIYNDSEQSIATTFSYERLERCMPGYGYPYLDNGQIDEEAPQNNGLFLVDLNSKQTKLLVSLSELAKLESDSYPSGFLHFVTHTEFSKDGRFISFLYRKIPTQGNYMKRYTKLMIYDLAEAKLITLPTQNSGSHYIWNHKNQLIASCIINGKSCHVLYDMNDIENYKIIAGNKLNSDGHQSFITDSSFVTDTYPDRYRMAKIYKTDINTQKVELLVCIYSPKKFQTKDFKCHIACDLHPRVSPSGKYICFDSPRTGKRGLYVMSLK